MTCPRPFISEQQRLAALAAFAIQDIAADSQFNDLVELAAQICDAPFAMISFVGAEKLSFHYTVGVSITECARKDSFCDQAIQGTDVLVVPDALLDPRFSNCSLVMGESKIRFYAGAPLITPNGEAIGTLCVLDHAPRELSPRQIKALATLGRQVISQFNQLVQLPRHAVDLSPQKNEALLSGQNQVLEMIAMAVPLLSTLNALMRIIESEMPDMICSVMLVDSDNKHLRHGAAPSLPAAVTRAIDCIPIGPDMGSCGTAAFLGEEVVVEDIATDPLCKNYKDIAFQNGLRACWSTPIRDSRKRLLGTFAMYFRQPARPTEQHRRLIEIATHISAIAIGRDQIQKDLRESLERFQIVSRVTNDVLWDWNIQTNAVSWSDGFISELRYTREDMSRGYDFWVNRLHPEDRTRVTSDLQDVLRGSELTWAGEYRLLRGDGTFAAIFDRAFILRGEDGSARRMIGAMQDNTARNIAENRIRHLNHVYTVISDINQVIARERNLEVIRGEACRIAVEKGRFRMAWIGTKDEAGLRVRIAAHSKMPGNALNQLETLLSDNPPAGADYFIQHAAQTGERIVCNSIEHDARHACWRSLASELKCKSMASFPLKVQGVVLGNFNLYSDEPDFFDQKELQLLDELASDIGLAMELNRRETERVIAEQTLRWRTAFFEAQVNSSPDAVLVVGLNAKIILRNERMIQLFGVPDSIAADTDNSKLLQHVTDRTRFPEEFKARVSHLYAHPDEIGFDEIELSDGTVLARYSAPVKDKTGTYYGRIWTFRDITERRCAENALKASEEQYRLLAENADDFVSLSGADFKRKFVSPSYFRITGWTLDDINRTDWRTRIHPDDVRLVEDADRANLAGETVTIEYRTLCKDGRWLTVEARCKPILDANGKVTDLLLWCRDVTERRRAEESLRASESRLNFALETSGLGAWELDLQTHVAYHTAIHDRIFGYTSSVPGWTYDIFLEHVLPQDRERIDRCFQAAIASRLDWNFECRIRRVDGEVRWIWVAGGIVSGSRGQTAHVSGIVLDITERRNAEESLRESEERFRQVVENIDEMFWIRSVETGEILYVSPAYEKIWGRTATEVYHAPEMWHAAIHPEDRDRIAQSMRTLESSGGFDETYRITRPDGTERWVRDRAFPVRDAAGHVFRVVGTASDISAQQSLEKQLRYSQKLEAFGLLAGGVAHDFNNLLTVVIGYCDIWLFKLPESAPIRAPLEAIKNAGERAAALTKQLLAFGRQTVMEKKVLNLNAVVRDTEKIIGRMIGEDIALKCILDPEIPGITIDPVQIGQVLINLAINARDAMATGGTLTVMTMNVARAAEGAAGASGDAVMLSVTDTGCGMSLETMARVFEPFFTTKEPGKGTGLGLAVVHGIVMQSGGSIRIQSEVGGGTTFFITFPATAEEPTPIGERVDIERNFGHETILVVEDEQKLCALIAEILSAFGYTVRTASDGLDALLIPAAELLDVDLLLTDVVMPDMNGRELAEVMTSRKPGLKVLFMSGYTDDAIMRHGVKQDEVDFLTKPFVPNTLLTKIRSVLGQR